MFYIQSSTLIIFALYLQSVLGKLYIRTRRYSSKPDGYNLNLVETNTWDEHDIVTLLDGGPFTKWVPIDSPKYFIQILVTEPTLLHEDSTVETFTCYKGLNTLSDALLPKSVLGLDPSVISRIEVATDVRIDLSNHLS